MHRRKKNLEEILQSYHKSEHYLFKLFTYEQFQRQYMGLEIKIMLLELRKRTLEFVSTKTPCPNIWL